VTWRDGAAARGLAAALAVVGVALPPGRDAAAQARRPTRAERAAATEREWRPTFLVYPLYDGLEGLSGYVVLGRRLPARRGPIANTAGWDVSAGISTSGSRSLHFTFDAPGWWPRWRLLAIVGAGRLQRAPFFGLGNAPHDSTPDSRRFYTYSLRRYTAFGAMQREVVPHVRALAVIQLRHYRALPLSEDTTLLGRQLAAGATLDTGAASGAELRAGLLYDTRDEEVSPSRGVLVEALVGRGLADLAYTRYALGARLFIPVGEMTTIGLRQSVELADGALPFYVMYERLTSWRPEDGFGGPTTLRSHLPGRFLAPNRAVLSAEIRYRKIDVPIPTSPFRIWFVGFADAGRVWMDGQSPSVADLHWDAGVGAFVQFSKSTLFGLNIGMSRVDGFEFGSAISFGF
jgi:outer membrane protein assembly factor BamA